MDSGIVTSPVRATGASTAKATPPLYPRPMDDADTPSTRKRPRLDSGEQARRNMSADRMTPSSNGPGSSPQSEGNQANHDDIELQNSRPPATPTRVTLNLREDTATTTDPSASQAITGSTTYKASSVEREAPDAPHAPTPSAITDASASRRSSPEIQVAEVEDVGQEPSITRWNNISRSIEEARAVQQDVLSRFPLLYNNDRTWPRNFNSIYKLIAFQDLERENIFGPLAEWIEYYLESSKGFSSSWWEILNEERGFWDELPVLMEAVIQRSESPRISSPAISIRSSSGHHEPLDTFSRFYAAWVSLCLRMTEIDCQTLRDTVDESSTAPDMISNRYMQTINITAKPESVVWKRFVGPEDYDNRVPLFALASKTLTGPRGGLLDMIDLIARILDRPGNFPILTSTFMSHFWVVAHLPLSLHHALSREENEEIEGAAHLFYSAFVSINTRLLSMIKKQAQGLSHYVCSEVMQGLDFMLRFLPFRSASLLDQLLSDRGLAHENLSFDMRIDLLRLSWRFDALKIGIMEGRMEIRVISVDMMQSELLSMYSKYGDKSPGGSGEIITRFLSDFLLQHRIVAYLLGPESHPQLMRAHNILGFLVVTQNLTREDTDTIWSTIFARQESRSSEGVQMMFTQCLNLCQLSTLTYLVDKFVRVSTEDLDQQTRNFAGAILEQLSMKARGEGGADVSMTPFSFCKRVIRQSAPDTRANLESTRGLHHWAMNQLCMLIRMLGTAPVRETLMKECLDDIADPHFPATGSISILVALLTEVRVDDLRDLVKGAELATFIVSDLQKLNEGRHSNTVQSTLRECLRIRLQLLEILLAEAPEIFTRDLAEQLWESLVGSNAMDDFAREAAWNTLNKATKAAKYPNTFIELCVSEFFLQLRSQHILPGCLEFANSIRLSLSQNRESEHDKGRNPTASDLMWHLSLKTPSSRSEMAKQAICVLVTTYLDSPDARSRGRDANDRLHVELVEICMKQLKEAASQLRAFSDGTSSGEDEPMIIVASEDEIEAQKTNFARSIIILTEFVRGVRARPMYSPSPELAPRLPKSFHHIEGKSITIKYQTFAESKTNSEIGTFDVGEMETVGELAGRLSLLSGFANFEVIYGGKRLDLEKLKNSKLLEAGFAGKGLVLVRKLPTQGSSAGLSSRTGLRPMEIEVLRHFNDLYDLLELEDTLACQVYAFLIEFPPEASIIRVVTEQGDVSKVFSLAAPFRLLYSLHALKHSLGHQSHTTAFQYSLQHAIAKVIGALAGLQFDVEKALGETDIRVAEALVETLGSFLRMAQDLFQASAQAKDLSDVARLERMDLIPSISQAKILIGQCHDLTIHATGVENRRNARKLVFDAFGVLLDASAVSDICWTALKGSGDIDRLVKRLLLEENRMAIRQSIVKLIKAALRPHSGPTTAFQEEFTTTFVTACLSLTKQTPSFERHTEQFFDVTLLLLNSTNRDFRDNIDYNEYISEWLALLIKHPHEEVVGRSEVDYFVLGLARLIIWCFQSARSMKKTYNVPSNTATRLFQTQLFPECHEPHQMPNLYSGTREQLYLIILELSQDSRKLLNTLRLVEHLNIDRDESSQGWSWGFASKIEDNALTEPNWNLERFKTLRSSVGHCGLRNLSNTCYMNSLFTQLYMNVDFREFMINLKISDGASSQRLLHETRQLFSYMQGSALKAIDTYDIADAIITYENASIDTSHQVDVDEFFNLLFDRWESQIVADNDKKRFRSFYGGNIVQQIKSKECSHISERLEPFSAIQCDVTGKSNLIESLNAYVHGEAMEGDNKYSCTSCGKYVDAVKRACLKDLPSTLIFHLKRFDYDLMHGTRSKVNQRFEFPLEIDMGPYNIEYLSDQSKPIDPDIYSLVGILVHSGTAESGHYYSYVQERSQDLRGKWIEFNDMDVSEFKSSDIDVASFGGWQDVSGYDTQFPKLWNAYMLFYERVDKQSPVSSATLGVTPSQISLPEDLQSQVGFDNQVFLRKFCQYDPAHGGFVNNLLRQTRVINSGGCSLDHISEKVAIGIALDHLANVLARLKETQQFEETIVCLNHMIGPCNQCCILALHWIVTNEHFLGDLLLKCPHPRVRREVSAFVMTTLHKLRQTNLLESNPFASVSVTVPLEDLQPTTVTAWDIVSDLVARLRGFWGVLHTCFRAWDDYFGLVAEIANMGMHEIHLVLREGFLLYCLELTVCDYPAYKSLRLHQPYTTYTKMLEKGRKILHNKFLETLAILFGRMNLQRNPILGGPRDRPYETPSLRFTEEEANIIYSRTPGKQGFSIFLDKLLNLVGNPPALNKIVKAIILAEPDVGLHPTVYWTIRNGIPVDPANLAQPFLQAALTYCECTPNLNSAESLIVSVADEVSTIGQTGGREHLEFFNHARRLRNVRNADAFDVFHKCVISNAHNWAPPLLIYWDPNVRQGALQLLRQLYFQHDTNCMDDEELADLLLENGKRLCKGCVTSCQRSLMEGKPVGRIVDEVSAVIRECVHKYLSREEDGNTIDEATDILDRLQALAISDMEDQVSDIGNNSDLPTDSDSEFPASP